MAIYNLHIAPIAIRDQQAIARYITEDLDNPDAAKRLLEKIATAIKRLETMPDMGALLSSIIAVDNDFRFLVTDNYLTFYRHVGNDVFIERVLYGKRDYIKVLMDGTPSERFGDGDTQE